MVGRRTHDYPHGKPPLLILVEIAAGIVGIFWVAFASRGWGYALAIATVFFSLGFVRSRLLTTYERTGDAVRLPRATAVVFINGTLAPIRALRRAFFVLVAALLFFGLAPMRAPVAKAGMISSIVSLFVVGILHFLLERHYVNTCRADEQYDRPSALN
jgi:hypothetical protein